MKDEKWTASELLAEVDNVLCALVDVSEDAGVLAPDVPEEHQDDFSTLAWTMLEIGFEGLCLRLEDESDSMEKLQQWCAAKRGDTK